MRHPEPANLRREVGLLVRLGAPLVGGQLAHTGITFLDTVMSGNLSAAALAAVAVGTSVWSSLSLFFLGVLIAVQPAVAQLAGAGRRDLVPHFTRQALWVSQGLGIAAIAVALRVRPLLDLVEVQPEIVPTVTRYLAAVCWGIPAWCAYLVLRFLAEGLGETRPTLWFGIGGLGLNAAANYALIYGRWGFPPLGAVGCGYATAAVWWAQLLGMALWVARRPAYRDLALFSRLELPGREAVGEILRVGSPIGVALFVEGSFFTAVALLVGSLGTEAVAAHQVAINFAAMTFMVPLGLSMAATVRVGHAVGGGDPASARFSAWVGVGAAVACQAVFASVMLLFPERVAGVYTDDPGVVAIAVELLFLAAIFQLSDGVQVSSAAGLRGYKDTRAPMAITVVAYWLLGLPLGWYLGFGSGLGPRGMWIGVIAGLSAAAALLARRLHVVSRRTLAARDRRARG